MTDSMLTSLRRHPYGPRRQVVLLLAFLGNLALGRVGHADEDKNVAQFNEFNRSGTEAYEKQDFKTAIKNFQQAYAIKPEPLLFYNIAQCYRKINHDAEAMTFYQSYLRRPETTDPELRAKAEGYLAELRGRHTAQPQFIYVENTNEPRPKWRIGLGAGLLAVSPLFLGFGGRALDLNGHCIDTPSGGPLKCANIGNTQGLGVGLVAAGAVFAIAGIVTIAIPGRRYQKQRPADPTLPTEAVKPMASLFAPTEAASLQAGSGL